MALLEIASEAVAVGCAQIPLFPTTAKPRPALSPISLHSFSEGCRRHVWHTGFDFVRSRCRRSRVSRAREPRGIGYYGIGGKVAACSRVRKGYSGFRNF